MMKTRKYAVVLLSIVAALCLALCVACAKPALKLDKTSLQLTVGETATITAETDETVEWSSSDEKVVTVRDGTVTAVAEGTATVTATAGGAVGKCEVTVSPSESGLSVALSKTTLELTVGEETTVVATAMQDGKPVQASYTWASEDQSVASVENGTVKGVAVGETRVSVKAAFGGKETTAYITVKVKLDAEITLASDGFSLSVLKLCEEDAQSVSAGAKLMYQDVEQSGVTFSYATDDEAVFTVDGQGVLTAVGAGKANLTVTAEFMDTEITAVSKVQVVNTNNVDFTVDFGDYDSAMLNKAMGEYDLTQKITASVSPYDEALNVEWISSNDKIVAVEYDGLNATVTAEEGCLGGEAVISLYVENIEVGYVIIGVYFPVSSEADLNAIDDSEQALTCWYLLTNDIRLENVYEYSIVTQNEQEAWNASFKGVFDGNGYTISNFRMGEVDSATSGNGTWNVGIIGYNVGTVRNLRVETEVYSWGSGTVFTNSLRTASGAVAAYNEGVIENCMAIVSMTNTEVATKPGGGIAGIMGANGIIRNCYVEVKGLSTIIPNHAATQNKKAGAFLGTFYNGTLENCWGLKVDNDLIQTVGYKEAGEEKDNYLATDKAALIEMGFGPDKLNGEVWNIKAEENSYTVEMNKGFRFQLDIGETSCEVGSYTAMVTKAVEGYNNTQQISFTLGQENIPVTVQTSTPDLISVENVGTNAINVTALSGLGGTAVVDIYTYGVKVASINIEIYSPVSTEADLEAIDDTAENLSGRYLMTNDIQLTKIYEQAIITQNIGEKWNGSFKGVFDGNGYTISNFRMSGTWNMGVFGYNRGVVRNLCVLTENYQKEGMQHVFNVRTSSGAIAARNGGTIENCMAIVDIVNPENATRCGGAIVGVQEAGGSVKNCYTEVSVHSIIPNHTSASYNVGAIIGDIGAGTVENCWSVKQDTETIQICGMSSLTGGATLETAVINCHIATEKAGLIEQGLNGETFDQKIWNVVVEDSAFTIALRNGCTVAAVSAQA